MSSLQQTLSNYPYRLILGSASPRRQELLRGLGFNFEVSPTHADESFPPHLQAQDIPLYLAEVKSAAFPRPLQENELLITSDTVVWCNQKIYNKPSDAEDAIRMLSELGGHMHEVFTAVCLRSAHKQVLFYDAAKVFFKPFRHEELEYYIQTCKPFDKAGSYGVQDWLGYTGIEKIEGSFYTVMGLPVKKLYENLLAFV